MPPLLKNPIAQKRWTKFRRHRRAWFSLWFVAILYGVSLCAEVICNSKPLYVRFNDHSYFPVFRYVPENAFLQNGRDTKPDYRALQKSPAFTANPANRIIFPLIPWDPYEEVDPQSLLADHPVALTFTPIPRVGSLSIAPDLAIMEDNACSAFLDKSSQALTRKKLTDLFTLPPGMLTAIAERFANRAAPSATATAKPAVGTSVVTLTLARFNPRSMPPKTVRMILRDADADDTTHEVRMTHAGTPMSQPPLWKQLPDTEKNNLQAFAIRSLGEPVTPLTLTIHKTTYRVRAEKSSVAWPYPPTRDHWLGIDQSGRDVLARMLYGLRASLTFAFLLVAVSMAFGIFMGAMQGYYAGMTDLVIQRLIEIWSALPFLYIMILLGSVYGRSFALLLFCYGIFNWIGISYYVRAEFLRLRHQPFVEAAVCQGLSAPRIIFHHILPNALTPVVTLFPFYLVGAISALTALDYLGFGLPSPTPSWGELLQQAQTFRWAWWLILYPSAMLFLVIISGAFIGEGVRDAYDPRTYSKLE
jgi:microcin C transport system permease protein